MAQHNESSRPVLRVGSALRADAYTLSGVLLLKAGKTIENEQQLLRLSQQDVIFLRQVPRIEMIEAVGRAMVESAMLRGEPRPPDFTQRLRRAAGVKYEVVRDIGSVYSTLDAGGDVDIELTRRAAARLTEEMAANNLALMSLTRLKDADDYTFTHSVNVAIVAMYVAMAGGEIDGLTDLGMGALLHDIGKIGTPTSILHKAGPLNDIEMLIVHEHPSYGADLLRGQGYTNEIVLSCVADHHEALAGYGYPNGKADDEISTYARLTSLADVFDAITTDRPYHKAMSPSDALAMMSQDGNGKFDPVLLRLLVSAIQGLPDAGLRTRVPPKVESITASRLIPDPGIHTTTPAPPAEFHLDALA